MANHPEEALKTPEKITYGSLLDALNNISKYFRDTHSPIRMVQRTIGIADRISRILGGQGANIYANGFPFSGGYNLLLSGSQAPPIHEINRFNEQKIAELKAQIEDPLKPYHCLEEGELKEEILLRPDGRGRDFTDQIYNCSECHPTLQQLFYPFPDLDVYIVVDNYPPAEVLELIQQEGRGLGLYPKYVNLRGMVDYFAHKFNSGQDPPLAIDYFFIRKEEAIKRLRSFPEDWPNLKIPCQMIRYGTQTFREAFLEFGKNIILDIQPIIQTDNKTRTIFETALKSFLEKNDSDLLLENFLATSRSSSKSLYEDPVIKQAVKLRHQLIREQGLVDMM